MTSEQSEGALLNEKGPQATVPVGKEAPNGSLEMNGHTPPPSTQSESNAEHAPKTNGATPAVDIELSKTESIDPAPQTPADETRDADEPAQSKEASKHDTPVDMDKVVKADLAAQADSDMPDAPVAPAVTADQTGEDKSTDALSPKSHPQPGPDAPEGENGDRKEASTDTGAIPADSAQPDEKADVAMVDTPEQVEAPPVTGSAESTQETSPADATPISPKADANMPACDSQNGPTTATTGTPPPPTTADTSMSETAQPSAKVSRDRDIDSEDEPVAKRTKVDHAADQVQVKTGPAPEDRMEVDQQPAAPDRASPYRANGAPKRLDDESLNDLPMTEFQNKQVRQVLAGVKKTKAGMLFRLPVQQLWPQLWADYSAKISNPTDISTMEKRLRGDLPLYATMGEFKRDLELMVQNAVTFNGEVHDVTIQAKACRDAILGRMSLQPAVEPPKPERKETAKAHTTRHVEPRAVAPPINTAGAGRPSKGAGASPAQKPVPESPAFALPPGSNGVPLIRRDSTKPDSRVKRPVKPAHSKDLVYDTKRKKKLPLDLRFCDEVLTELRKTKHYDINAAFVQPVDPVALNIPTYHKVIKKPMDLGTMATKLAAGEYATAKDFEKDFDLIIKNCRTFNGEDHIVYNQALRLQDLYRAEMSKKDEWMAKHAPVSNVTASHATGRDESDSEDADSEGDGERDEERKQIENRLATIQKRLEQEQKKVNEMVNSGTSDITDVEIAQSVVAMLQKQLMGERAKLANLPAKKPSKSKPAKSKKSGGAANVSQKKAAVTGPVGGAPRKSGPKKAAPKKKVGQMEKDIIVESLSDLEGPLLERAIELIKRDTGQGENDAGELELDIETISEDALVKLYEIVIKAFPNARIERERQLGLAAPPSSDPPAPKARPASKSKKNKPMSKSEQERRIQQLNELRAQAGRQASGSQEPMESIEGNGNEPLAQPEHESEDEVDSEED